MQDTIFDFRDQLIDDYASYVNSFLHILDPKIQDYVQQKITEGALWPEPLIQLNPLFELGESVDALVAEGVLHRECARIFRKSKSESDPQGQPLRLHRHQSEAIRVAQSKASYVLTTGTGSGKSLAYIIPIVNHALHNGSGRGIQAIVCYPMNALANSQVKELEKFLKAGYTEGKGPVTFARYTGQESDEERARIIMQPPDILLTNYVMLELILTRATEQKLLANAQLHFLVLDELHTYRGRQGADVALLVRRVRNRLATGALQCVGTSATLAGSGSYAERQAGVAHMATQIFGTTVRAEQIIGETLRPVTSGVTDDETFRQQLIERVQRHDFQPPSDYQGFINDPLSIWIERTFGIIERDGRIERNLPRSISGPRGAAQKLSDTTGVDLVHCVEAIQHTLLAGYECEPIPETGRPPFAFRLHQFITRGDMIHASLETVGKRYLTLNGQRFVPDGSRTRVLLPLVFCRECGQEYYCVRESAAGFFVPRALNDQLREAGRIGFLYASQQNPWPDDDDDALIERLPEDWIEEFKGGYRVRRDRKKDLPAGLHVHPDGRLGEGSGPVVAGDGLPCSFIPAPFRFCLHCGVSYNARQRLDFGKLAALSSEGRSTATTILSLSAIRHLREKPQEDIPAKLLSFTDNRQDASLQAGHFNDFVEVGILRSALYRAIQTAGVEGLHHDTLTLKVFEALNLPFSQYASDAEVKYQARTDTQQSLRNVLGYRLYCDLRRGWRITSPNLEQAGLLNITYVSLDEVCQDTETFWRSCHEALRSATPATREKIGKVLLDYMRRELAIKVDYLDPLYQDRLWQQSSQRLAAPWALDENEAKIHAAILLPRSHSNGDYGGNTYLSARGGFGQYLRRKTTLTEYSDKLTLADTEQIIKELLEGLRQAALVERVQEPVKKEKGGVPGYQLPASALIWTVGDGTRVFHDPIRVPRASRMGHKPNTFFVSFYRGMSAKLNDLRAYEHTAQVPNDLRQQREDAFRKDELPILYCSPTMELGVDISELNLVHMRNIPPTPANYAQRSGRAGRSGQPALVVAYCSTGSPHDQYFFKRPEQMVAGSVTPPRLDLANEDLVRAHVHAIWLAETGLSLGRSLPDLLDIAAENVALPLFDWVRASVEDTSAKARALQRATAVLTTLQDELQQADWYQADWLANVLSQVAQSFDRTAGRWRELYRGARKQIDIQHKIRNDPARSTDDRERAERLRSEAEAQEKLLTDISTMAQSDFYSYRYYASEGFLPGYNFPRLPLSAYIPARRARQQDRNEYLSRPRFLAISEFGPRAMLYHEGSRYEINRVILSAENSESLTMSGVKQCGSCGYLHPLSDSGVGLDVCEHCGARLDEQLRHLFRLQNVATRRRDKINSDEEERVRLGYDIRTAVRFEKHDGSSPMRMGQANEFGQPEARLAKLTYGHAATLWRINLGWMRRKDQATYGFMLDIERGTWEKNEQGAASGDDEVMSPRTARVIPYVEDRRNCLLFQPSESLETAQMASLQAALKNAIQVRYQLEDNELAVEPLPDMVRRRQLLFYEAAEGGAGVLRRLIDDPLALREVAHKALELCHFDVETGEDLRHAPRASEDCEAACYDCLLTYANQHDHQLLDRRGIRDFLLRLARGQVIASANATPRPQHLEQLQHLTGSSLEEHWLKYLEERGHLLPTQAQPLIAECSTRPDFLYENTMSAIYIDGPYHDYPERQIRDAAATECLEDRGYFVIRFGHQDDWDTIIAQYPSIFGRH